MFRVWAPHARRVRVLLQAGPYWEISDDTRAFDLQQDGDDWCALILGVKTGELYRFEIATEDSRLLYRLDPAAADVVDSELTRNDASSRNGAIVLAPSRVNWSPFQTPRFEDFLIYQLHVGTFAGRNDELNRPWSTFRDLHCKLGYVRELGFNCIQLLPIHEFQRDRSWGYNPASFFAPESSYGSPLDLMRLVDAAHQNGLAVIFDVVYNHAGPGDNVLWEYDGYRQDGGIYFEGGRMTSWGRGPAWWKREVREFFYQNARMFFERYHADGLRFDVTTQIDGEHLRQVVTRLRSEFPNKYLIAEHLPDHPWIIREGGFCATWQARTHHETQRALVDNDPLRRIQSILGWDGYDHSWNLVKYTLGSHDDIGDQNGGNAEDGLSDWDRRHRYLIDQLGGRDNPWARAKCRLAWGLNIAMPGTPMLFMGSECQMGAPQVGWGYWHDGIDANGDHRFDWSIAGDPIGIAMRRFVADSNRVRWENPALRADSLSICHWDETNQVLGFLRGVGANLVLAVVNLGPRTFSNHSYGVRTAGLAGRWTQMLCSQDPAYGGWAGAGNAYHEPWTQTDGHIYVNLPEWSVSLFRRL
jgi:1,4-alpha-glucan branching enzyme